AAQRAIVPVPRPRQAEPVLGRRIAERRIVDAELQLAALIKDIALDGCKRSNRSKKMRMAAWMSIEWKLFDALAREVIYEGATEGQVEGTYDANISAALNHVRSDAFRSALHNLMADQDFVDRLHGKAGNTALAGAAVPDAPSGPLNLELQYGKGGGSFVKDVETLKTATVTIRSTNGHGTGFVVDQRGYVLTNAHVVGNASNVVIKIGENEHAGAVLRRDRKRDVALVQIADQAGVATLKLASSRTSTGAPVYVMGTPLDEALSHTVTRGIISAVRKLKDDQIYYQTDAGVNPGNSGGPAFNESGEVVGMAVSGIFTRQGGTTNINFLIPIDEVLGTLQVF
ncbi:MAG: trypsin-like peptidase domain-containing protein, partial [Pseudomonadota bacterium]